MEKGSNPAGGPVLTIHGFPSSSHDWSKVCLPVYWAARLSVCLSFSLSACGYKKKIRPPFMNYKSIVYLPSPNQLMGKKLPLVFIYILQMFCAIILNFFFSNAFKIVLDLLQTNFFKNLKI